MKNKFTAWHHRKRNKKIIIFNPVNKNVERWNPKKKKKKKSINKQSTSKTKWDCQNLRVESYRHK